jgi:hypothetical protein
MALDLQRAGMMAIRRRLGTADQPRRRSVAPLFHCGSDQESSSQDEWIEAATVPSAVNRAVDAGRISRK